MLVKNKCLQFWDYFIEIPQKAKHTLIFTCNISENLYVT